DALRASALASDGDVFVATGMAAVPARLGNRAGDLVGVDAAIGRGFREIPRLAIGSGGISAAGLALGQALVDAVAVALIGDDEDAAVGGCSRGGGCENAGQNRGNGSHAAPIDERSARNCPDWHNRKRLRMINHAGRGRFMPQTGFSEALDAIPPAGPWWARMNGFLAICGICREIMS